MTFDLCTFPGAGIKDETQAIKNQIPESTLTNNQILTSKRVFQCGSQEGLEMS